MLLSEKISIELKAAMKSGDQKTVGLLRFLIAQMKNKEIEKHSAGQSSELSDEEVLEIFRKESKKRKEAINLFEQGNRADLADKEKGELEMIERYLPAQMGKEDIRKVVKEIKFSGATEFSAIIKEAMARLKGQADGKLVSEVIKEES